MTFSIASPYNEIFLSMPLYSCRNQVGRDHQSHAGISGQLSGSVGIRGKKGDQNWMRNNFPLDGEIYQKELTSYDHFPIISDDFGWNDQFNVNLKFETHKVLRRKNRLWTILHFAKSTHFGFAAKSCRGPVASPSTDHQAGLQGEHHCEYGHRTWKNLGCCDEHRGDEIHLTSHRNFCCWLVGIFNVIRQHLFLDRDHQIGPIWGGSSLVVVLEGFPLVPCLGWQYNDPCLNQGIDYFLLRQPDKKILFCVKDSVDFSFYWLQRLHSCKHGWMENPPFWWYFTRTSMWIFYGELLVERRVPISFVDDKVPTISLAEQQLRVIKEHSTVRSVASWRSFCFELQKQIHSWKPTWHWKISIFNRKYIFKWWIFHRHVSFRGGNHGQISNEKRTPHCSGYFSGMRSYTVTVGIIS